MRSESLGGQRVVRRLGRERREKGLKERVSESLGIQRKEGREKEKTNLIIPILPPKPKQDEHAVRKCVVPV